MELDFFLYYKVLLIIWIYILNTMSVFGNTNKLTYSLLY
jgi:hypothetical protein